MVTYREAQLKRIFYIFVIIIYDLLQILLVLYLQISESTSNFWGYTLSLKSEINLNWYTIVYLLIGPFILSYLSIMSNVTSNRGLVQIVGPQSLLQTVRRKFHPGNPDGEELDEVKVQHFLEEMAQGEPPGTLDNLNMLLSIGIETEKLIVKSGINSVKRVYMSDQNIPNAFTLRFIPLPFIGQDWIIINRNVVDILDLNEIQAIVAHEIGHAKRFDSWINSFLSAPKFVILFGWSIILFRLIKVIFINGINNLLFLQIIILFILVLFIRFSLIGVQYLTDLTHRQAELLADHYAGQLVGPEALINALIKIGRRAEVLNAIKIDLEWLTRRKKPFNVQLLLRGLINTLNPGEISLDSTREDVLRTYIKSSLADTFQSLKIQISKEEFNRMVEESVGNLSTFRESEQKPIILKNQDLLIESWRDVDKDFNEYLSKDEIALLASKLKTSGHSIFENEALQRLGILPPTPSHPQVHTRIIFVHDTLLDKS